MSKYGDALDAMDQDRERQAASVAGVATRYNPDQYAAAIDKSNQVGVPAHVIASDPQAFERPSKYGAALDAQDAPTTQEWLTNLDNAAVAQDDVESLSMIERGLRAIRGYGDVQRASAAGLVKTPGTTLSGFGRFIEAGGRYTERGIRAIGGDWFADALSVDTPWWITPSEILRRPGDAIKRAGEAIDAPQERQNIATEVAGGVGQLGAQVLTQVLTGGLGGTLSLFAQGADIMGERAEESGATTEQTDASVLLGASITALTERYGLDALLNRVPPQIKNAVLRQVTDIAVGGGIEAAQEAVEGLLHNLTAKAIFDPNAPLFEGLDREAVAAGGAGAIARAVMNAVIPGRQVSFADQDRQTAEQIATIAQQSKLAQRSPQKLEELVAAIKAQTGTEFAYIDAAAFRTLYQSDQEAAQAAADLTGSTQTYFEAAISNTKMAIPLEKYISKFAASKNAQSLLDHVTFTPDGMTAAEAKEAKPELEALAKEIAEKEVTEARPDTSQSIYDDVLAQLEATGMERSTAEKNAALTQVVFRTLGQRTGIDSQELYQRYGLKIQRQELSGVPGFDQTEGMADDVNDSPVPGGHTRLYRATIESETDIKPWTSWTEDLDTAEAYTDNQGFGGPRIRQVDFELLEDDILDVGDIQGLSGKIKLAEALEYDDPQDEARRWQDSGWNYPWEESAKVKKAIEASGYKALRYEDDFPAGAITTVIVKPPKRSGSVTKSAVAVKYDQRFNETKRGAIQFGADRQFTISLLEKADLSTYLHESGHFYLEVLADLAEDASAPQQIKDDFSAILKWMGLKSRAELVAEGAAKDSPEARRAVEAHEQFARGFEQYLMEGKSPSVEMQSVFARFRAWLVSVYRTLARLNVNLTDDVRRVMDRIVATDEEIDAAEGSMLYAPIFTTAEDFGQGPEAWEAYKVVAIRAHQEHVEELTDRALKQLTREQKSWWKDERAKVLDAVTTEVNQQPVYRALAFLQKGQNSDGSALPEGVQAAKLNKAALVDKYGKDFLKRLPRGITAKEGLSSDTAAALFGFDSGDALVEALANARPKAQLIEMEADARMREKYGDMLTDGSLAEQAMQSVHTEGRAKVMAAELKALNKKRREVGKFVRAAQQTEAREQRQAREANAAALPVGDELKAIKAGVQRIIQGKKVRDIQPNLYRMAEAKAARKAFELAGKGKYEEAYQEKRRQILNHELYRAALKAREEVDSIVEFMRSFDRKATRERLAKAKGEYLQQIDALRERFDFSNVSNITDLKRTALMQWVTEQEAAGREVNVPDYLLNEARKTPYKELLLAELQGLHDVVKNIDHLARTKDKLLKNRAATEWQDAKQELSERIELQKGKAPPVSRFERTNMEEYGALATEMADSWLRPETIVEWLDGGESGPWHDYLMEPANNAEYRRETLRDKILKPLRDLAEKITKKRRADLHEDITIKSLGRSFNRRTLLSIVLNMGNESNMERLTDGGFRDGNRVGQFTPQSLQEIVAALNAEDVKFLNTAWATVEQLWPETQEFQRRMGGLVPEKIQATPIQTKHGELTGGYWPVVYDSLATRAGQKQAETSDPIATIMGQNFAKATTKKGHLKGRTSAAGPLLLDYAAVAGRHTEQVITDLTHREFAIQAMRVLDDADLRLKLQDVVGETAWKSLRGMVRHTVEQDGGYSDAANRGQERIMRRLLSNTAVAALGFRAVTAWGNVVLAPIQAAARVSPKYIAIGIGKFYRHPIESTKFIHDSSEMMRQRAKNMDHTFNVVMETLKGQRGFRAKAAQAAMSIHTTGDFLATHGLWLGRYQESLDAGESHEEAVRLADKSIRQTQTAGAPKDLSAFERDPRYSWFKMFLGPMLIQGNRIRESFGRNGVVKSWPQAFGTLTAAWFLPAVLWDLMTGRGPDDDDDDGSLDDAALWSLRKLIFYPFLTMPFLRDAASIVERKIAGQYAEPRMTPLADAGYLVYQAGQRAWHETGDWMDGDDFEAEKVIKAGLRASGPLFGIPANQIDVTGSYLYDLYTGDDEIENLGDLRYLAIRRDN